MLTNTASCVKITVEKYIFRKEVIMLEKLKKFGWGYILIGAILIAIGVSLIASQDAYETLAIIIGCILTVVGIGFIIYTMLDRRRNVKFALKLSIGVIAVICGIVTMIARSNAITVIVNVLCLLLIVDSAFKLQLSILSRRLSYYGWWLITSLSVAIIISAFLLCKFTPTDPAALTTYSGIIVISDGVLNLLSAFFSSAVYVDKDEDSEKLSPDGEGEGDE